MSDTDDGERKKKKKKEKGNGIAQREELHRSMLLFLLALHCVPSGVIREHTALCFSFNTVA